MVLVKIIVIEFINIDVMLIIAGESQRVKPGFPVFFSRNRKQLRG